MSAVASANLTLKFLLELGAVVAFALWGASCGGGAVSVFLAIAAPATMVVLWGRLAAPRSARRLRASARIAFELCVFALAALALLAAVGPLAGVAFATVAIANALALAGMRQWAH